MTMHWSARFECPTCQAIIRCEDEAPPWQEDEDLHEEIRDAERWLAEHGAEAETTATWSNLLQSAPNRVIGPSLLARQWRPSVHYPDNYSYFPCPACLCGKITPECGREPAPEPQEWTAEESTPYAGEYDEA